MLAINARQRGPASLLERVGLELEVVAIFARGSLHAVVEPARRLGLDLQGDLDLDSLFLREQQQTSSATSENWSLALMGLSSTDPKNIVFLTLPPGGSPASPPPAATPLVDVLSLPEAPAAEAAAPVAPDPVGGFESVGLAPPLASLAYASRSAAS